MLTVFIYLPNGSFTPSSARTGGSQIISEEWWVVYEECTEHREGISKRR